MGIVLQCSGLRRSFGARVVVDDVGFTVHEGETYGLLGPNGAGKTTTISMISGILRRDGGTVEIAGHSLDREPMEARRQLGYVPQELALYPELSGKENLEFFGRLYRLGGSELRQRVGEVLGQVGLSERARDHASEYSGGMKRRLNIAIGMLPGPKLLILDEPTVGVDPQSRAVILDSIDGLRRMGMAVLYTTHYMEEAERLCDRIGIMDEGKLIAEGTNAELVQRVGEHDAVDVLLSGRSESALARVANLPFVLSASGSDGGLRLVVDQADHHLPELVQALTGSDGSVSGITVSKPNLESVFLQLTGRALRD